jgi:hypothetical protein
MEQRFVSALAFPACLLICGVTLGIGRGSGLFWLPAAYVVAIIQALWNAWVIAVESRRARSIKPSREKTLIEREIPR